MSHNFGNTTNFQVASTDSFWGTLSAAQQTNVTANANYLLGQVEPAFTTTTGWFGTDTTKFGTSNRQQVLLDQKDGTGANNSGYGNPSNPINEDSQSNNSTIGTAGPIVSMLWMAEWSEVLMSLTSNWNAGYSSGEAFRNFAISCSLRLDTTTITVLSWIAGSTAGRRGHRTTRSLYLRPTLRDPTGLLRHLPVSLQALAIRYMVTVT